MGSSLLLPGAGLGYVERLKALTAFQIRRANLSFTLGGSFRGLIVVTEGSIKAVHFVWKDLPELVYIVLELVDRVREGPSFGLYSAPNTDCSRRA